MKTSQSLSKSPKRKYKKRSERDKLKEKLWNLCKEYVRKRDNCICQKCHRFVSGSNCETSHVIPKSHGNILKFDKNNLKILCHNCHFHWWHKNPLEAQAWFAEKFPDRYEYLMQRKEEHMKLTVIWLEEKIEEYKKLIEQGE